MKTKRMLYAVEELLLAYPNLAYENGSFYQEDELVEQDADQLIIEYYAEFSPIYPNGKEYIEVAFNNDFKDAFDQISYYSNLDRR